MVPEIVGIVGLQGSGKTEITKVLAEFDIPCIRMGDIVREEVRKRGLEINERNVAKIANELRRHEGLSAIAKRCVPLIKSVGEEKRAIVIDGIRGVAEVKEFRRAFGDRFHLIAVWANEHIRSKRVKIRKRADDAMDLKAFREKDRRELAWGLGEAFVLADFIILNEGSLEELRKQTIEILEGLMGEKCKLVSTTETRKATKSFYKDPTLPSASPNHLNRC